MGEPLLAVCMALTLLPSTARAADISCYFARIKQAAWFIQDYKQKD